MDADCAGVLRKAPFLGGQKRPARRHSKRASKLKRAATFLLLLRGIVSALTSDELFLQNILLAKMLKSKTVSSKMRKLVRIYIVLDLIIVIW